MTTDKQARKERPIARGFADYFPRAIAEVAHVSYVGNQQHNPGQPLHWDKSKSTDHADCLGRHFLERGTMDVDGVRHSAKLAWRAMALLELELEAAEKVDLRCVCQDCENIRKAAPGQAVMVQDPKHVDAMQKIGELPSREECKQANTDYDQLIKLGCPAATAKQIVQGTTYSKFGKGNDNRRDMTGDQVYVYLAGPMRGYAQFNFPAFDLVRDELVKKGYNVISPADIDRAAGDTDEKTCTPADQATYALRDFWALYFLKRQGKNNSIVLLPKYERSTGATAEFNVAKWMGLGILYVMADFPEIAAKLSDQAMQLGADLEGKEFYNPTHDITYRVQDSHPRFRLFGSWIKSSTYKTMAEFHKAIANGVLIPCESSSSATSTNPSATPATCASARTCTVEENVMPLSS